MPPCNLYLILMWEYGWVLFSNIYKDRPTILKVREKVNKYIQQRDALCVFPDHSIAMKMFFLLLMGLRTPWYCANICFPVNPVLL